MKYLEWRINGFLEAVNFCRFFDLGYNGNRFTWERCRNTQNWVLERLNRALATRDWQNNFPNAKVFPVESASSDHAGIFLTLGVNVICYAAKPFWFENFWMKEIDIKQAVQTTWEHGKGQPIAEMIKSCVAYLLEWGKNKKQQFKAKLKQAKAQMTRYRNSSNPYHLQSFNSAKEAHLQALEQQNIYWKQRAKQHG
ncbi:uncharacterized protein LOC132053676 [Lycium ferocissimum]|uniref:uncharacterized protein LOC132053676 n=1 Tax=Lycium ferocissimum TaxID=112874 RepID=UPI002815B053|nr:uncharacterized protein LOC132053676 [Lycium ferocissimum]